MMRLQIGYHPTHTISLTSDAGESDDHHLHIQVDDLRFAMPHQIAPQPEHLARVLAFTKDLTDDDRLLVSCVQGRSRSTAMAIGILVQHGMTYQKAFDHVQTLRPDLLPNEMIIRYIDDHFDLHGDLIALVKRHRVLNTSNNR